MAVLPFALLAGGLTLTSATDVVIFAVACMALNILVGHTGLVSFGHGAWFGVGAYAAALAQRYWFPGSVLWPTLVALAILLSPRQSPSASSCCAGAASTFRCSRSRFSALTYAIAFRWTAFTGGESGLGGVTRATWFGIDLENPWIYYALVAAFGLAVVYALAALSPLGDRHRAGRHPRERAARAVHRLRDQPLQADRVRRIGGADRLRRHAVRVPSSLRVGRPDVDRVLRRAARDGHHRRHAQPARSRRWARCSTSCSRNTCRSGRRTGCCTSACCSSAFIVFSPTGLVGVWRRLTEPFKPKVVEAAAMDARAIEQGVPLPEFLKHAPHAGGVVLEARDLAKSFGGIKAVTDASLDRSRPHAARADRTQRRRQDDGVQSDHRHVRARSRFGRARRPARSRDCRRIELPRRASAARSRSPTCFRACRSPRICVSPCRRATRRISTAGPTRSATSA